MKQRHMKIKKNSRILSNTRLKARIKVKTNPEIVETIKAANENSSWKQLAKVISSGSRKYASVNLSQIDKETKTGDTVIVPGKVLSSGDLSKKVRICALSISNSAREKLKKTKSEFALIKEEIKINKKAEGLKVIN